MFKLIKNCEVYAPQKLGIQDVLICGEKIIQVAPKILFNEATVIEGEGLMMIPGFIDQHIHLTGGGGEGGFHTRTPEVQLSALIKSGLTTVVGLLGTDAYSRSIEDLLSKVKALNHEGITVFCLTGSYRYPSPTLTGSIGKDITYVEEIIGLKIAIADHRSSQITYEELKRVVSEVRVAALLSQKAGIITFHVGDEAKGINDLFKLIEDTDIPIFILRPTHVTRKEALFEKAVEFAKKGGYIDLTISERVQKLKKNFERINNQKVNKELVTFSSDGNGSFSTYDQNGQLTKIGVASCDGILRAVQYLIEEGYPIEEVIRYGSTNVAEALKLSNRKGYIKEGFDADLLLVSKNLEIQTVIAKGKVMMENSEVLVKGTFEV